VLQTILNVMDFGMTALEAVSAPRIDCQGDFVYLEGRIPQSVCDELAGTGLAVRRDSASYGAYPTSAARVQAIVLDGPAGGIRGGSDPRGYGVALGL
jgi:gamma-glutamyltranspeptidase/glutathione hydrolase